jgi:hypothetical protein
MREDLNYILGLEKSQILLKPRGMWFLIEHLFWLNIVLIFGEVYLQVLKNLIQH